jgi:hypothetical protein
LVESGRGTDEEGTYRVLGCEKGVMGVGATGVIGLIERIGATGASWAENEARSAG